MEHTEKTTPRLLEQTGVGADGDQSADSTALLLDVETIIVADRYRKEIGDIGDLRDSIANVGLLNPITVREWHGGYRLVAGERRLTAFKSLGLAEIPARVARDIADARDALVAERDENTARKPMLPSEAMALGMAIEEMEKPAAMERMHSKLRQGANVPLGSREPSGEQHARTREIAADAVGISRPSYTRMKTLVTTAADDTAPEEVREAAREAMDAIDQGAPVRGSYDKVKDLRRKVDAALPFKSRRANDNTDYLRELAENYPTLRIAFAEEGHTRYASADSLGQAARIADIEWQFTEKQWQARVNTSRDVLDRSTLAIEVALDAINVRVDMTTITPEQATAALERLDRSALNRIINQLKEISNV